MRIIKPALGFLSVAAVLILIEVCHYGYSHVLGWRETMKTQQHELLVRDIDILWSLQSNLDAYHNCAVAAKNTALCAPYTASIKEDLQFIRTWFHMDNKTKAKLLRLLDAPISQPFTQNEIIATLIESTRQKVRNHYFKP